MPFARESKAVFGYGCATIRRELTTGARLGEVSAAIRETEEGK
jgi:hypothetical protein